MCVSFESESLPSHRDVLKLVKVTEERFSQKKELREPSWCANYLMDTRENNDFLFILVNNFFKYCKLFSTI